MLFLWICTWSWSNGYGCWCIWSSISDWPQENFELCYIASVETMRIMKNCPLLNFNSVGISAVLSLLYELFATWGYEWFCVLRFFQGLAQVWSLSQASRWVNSLSQECFLLKRPCGAAGHQRKNVPCWWACQMQSLILVILRQIS